MKNRVHIFGASGSGTTTIAKNVCERLGYKHFDADNYFWMQTEAPYTVERPRDECLKIMNEDLQSSKQWVLSGSLTGWGDAFVPLFDLVVFVYINKEIRIERLKKREWERFGDEILLGNERYDKSREFIEWADSYDDGTKAGRSLEKHEKWLLDIKCKIVKINNDDLDTSIATVIENIEH